MTDTANQALALVGAVIILGAYGAHALKRISNGALYLTLNFIGGALLCWAAVNARQLGFILLEGAWALISLLALLRLKKNSDEKFVNRQ